MAQQDGATLGGPASSALGLNGGEKLVVLAGGVMAALAITAIMPVLPTIEKQLAHSATDAMLVKQLIGGVTLAMVVGAPLGGFLSGRIGMRAMLLGASLIYAIAGTAGLYLSSLPALLISRLFLGAAAATIQVMSIVLVNTRLAGNDRAKWMGLHVALATFCALLINPLSGALGTINWRWPFAEYLLGLVLFAALLAVRDRAKSPLVAGSTTAGAVAGKGPSILAWFPWRFLPLSLLVGAVTFMPTIYLPFLLREEAGLTPGGIAAYLTGAALLGGTTALLYGRARTRISTNAAFLFSFACAGTGALIVGLAHTLPAIVVGGVLHSIGIAWFVPNMMTALGGKVGPTQQARAAGLVKAVHFSSAPLSVVLIEPFARSYGAPMVMLVTSALAFVVVLVMLARIARPGHSAIPAHA